MTTPALIETGQYKPDGSCVCLAGTTVALLFGIEEPSEGAGPIELADISGRFFVQRVHARDGTLLIEVEPTRPDDQTVRFDLQVSRDWLAPGAKAADLTHTIVELLEGDEDEIITRPFSIRGLRSGLPGAQLSIVPGTERFHVRYVGSKGDSAAQQLKDAGLIDSNSGDALAAYLREPAETASAVADEATAAANQAAELANSKAALADQKAALADAKASLANTAAGAATTAADGANGAAGAANTAADLAILKAAQAQAAADAANEVALGQKVKGVSGSYVVQAEDHLKLIVSGGGEIYLDADLPDTLTIEVMPVGATPVEVFPGPGATVNGTAGRVAVATAFSSAQVRPVSATGWVVTDGDAVAGVGLISRPQFNTERASGHALAWLA